MHGSMFFHLQIGPPHAEHKVITKQQAKPFDIVID